MGCTKSSQKSELENNKENEIIYNEPNHNNPNLLKKQLTKNFILESLNNQITTENQTNKNELPLEEEKKLLNNIEGSVYLNRVGI